MSNFKPIHLDVMFKPRCSATRCLLIQCGCYCQVLYHLIKEASLSLYLVTPCVTPYWNSGAYLPLSHFHFQRPLLCIYYFLIPHSNLNPLIHSQNSVCLTLPDLPLSCPFPIYPDQRFHNPISDLLIPVRAMPLMKPQ